MNNLFLIPSKTSAVDGFVSLAVVKGAVVLCSGVSRIMLDWLRASDSRLVLNGVKDLVDGES